MAVPVGDKRATAPHAEAEGKPQKQNQKVFTANEDAPGRAAPNRRQGRAPSHGGNGSQVGALTFLF